MEREKIVKDVKVILDENVEPFETLDIEGEIADPDQLQTDTLIARLIGNAIDTVNQIAPVGMLSDVVESSATALEWEDYDDYCSRAELPDDFLRVTYVKLGGWKRGAAEFLDEEDDLFAKYFAEQAGVRPTKMYPSAAMVTGNLEGRLDIVACPRGDGESSEVRYIRKSIDGVADEYAIAKKCYWAVIYMIAKLYYVTIGERERASMMEAEVAQRLGLEATKDGNAQ